MNQLPWVVLLGLLAIAAVLGIGLKRSGVADTTNLSPSTEPSWVEQVEAVRRGESRAIRTTRRVTDAQFEQLRGLRALQDLRLENGAVSSDALLVLEELPQLETLWLWKCRLDNEAMQRIAQNRQLKRLNLPHSTCDDDAFALLVDIPQLAQLRFSSREVTAQGLSQVSRAQTLRLLHLIDVPVTGVVLTEIAKLPELQSLYLDGVDVPVADMERFFAARPDVHVHIDQLHHTRDPRAHKHSPHPPSTQRSQNR